MEQRFAFVLRIWLTEAGSATGHKPYLRGALQSINSTEPSYFNSLRQLNDLLETALQQNDVLTSSPMTVPFAVSGRACGRGHGAAAPDAEPEGSVHANARKQ